MENLKFDSNGLITTVVQDAATKDVLMVAWMNAETLQRTIESGETWFWSRSRQELWHKGATSGNTQKVVEILYDCDGDTLLVLVEPARQACHTGEQTCFFRNLNSLPLVNNPMSRIVIKLGSSTLTAGTSRLSLPRFVEITRQVSSLSQNGYEVILVSSGAIAAGKEQLKFPQLPRDVPAKQMLAAVGQLRLMAIYEQVFGLYGLTIGQVLLTRADLGDRRRYLNSRNTLMALLAQNVIPIINENDTVATEEIRVGDNDNLSALVANLMMPIPSSC